MTEHEEPVDDAELDAEAERLTKLLGNILMQTVNEFMVMTQLEASSFLSPIPPELFPIAGSSLDRKLYDLVEKLGGPPRLMFRGEGEPPPTYDTYARAAIKEALATYNRARTAVCRAHMYLTGSWMIENHPDSMHLPEDPHIRDILVRQTAERFWEHTETAFIRLASHWDRIGQLLDFAYFNIRQYERDGFPAVMDRIHTNAVPVNSVLASSASWIKLRQYQTSQHVGGLKWLLRRRNLLVHSLHLAPRTESEPDDPIFQSAYNHLDVATRNKLRPAEPTQELESLHTHLRAAADLFEPAVDIAILFRPS